MTKLKILVVDGNTRETDAAHVAAGGAPTGAHYASVLSSLRADVHCTLVHPAHPGGATLPDGVALASFDGMAWTGSALNVYNDRPEVRAQVELARAAFAAGVPQFGSCWGLQVAATAVGGTVRVNPLGREIGVARQIKLTKAGGEHPMFEHKRGPFDAIAVHMDEISALPPNATVLAGNAMSAVQAVELRHKAGTFWGTQYHPEYDLNEIATVIVRYDSRLVEAGIFVDMKTLSQFVADLRSLQVDPTRTELAARHGLGMDVLDAGRRRSELKQWLERQVLTHAQRIGSRHDG